MRFCISRESIGTRAGPSVVLLRGAWLGGLGSRPVQIWKLDSPESESQVSCMRTRPVGLERKGRSGVMLLPLPAHTLPHTIGDTISRCRENFEYRFRHMFAVGVCMVREDFFGLNRQRYERVVLDANSTVVHSIHIRHQCKYR